MAAELELIYPVASSNIYAVIRRHSDAYVWNGSDFVPWSDANIADYGVALTDKGGDLYQGDMPAVAAARYRITYYLRAGATPAITDTILASRDYTWDGADLSSASEVTISAYALTSLAEVKRYLRLTSATYDTVLTEMINAVTNRIEREAGRQFKARDYREWVNGDHQVRVVLRQHPVISVDRVAHGQINVLSATYSGTGIRAHAQATETAIVLKSISTTGVTTTSTLTYATYPTTSQMADAISAVAGWTGANILDCLTADLYPLGGQDAKGRTVFFTAPDVDTEDYWVDRANGIISWTGHPDTYHYPFDSRVLMPPRGFQNLLIQYRAGYETIPDDLNMLCRELVAQCWQTSKTNGAIQSESLGDYSYTLADKATLTADQEAVIRRWSNIRIARS